MLYFSNSCKRSTLSLKDEHGCQTWKLYFDIPDQWKDVSTISVMNLLFSAKSFDHIDEITILSNLVKQTSSVYNNQFFIYLL